MKKTTLTKLIANSLLLVKKLNVSALIMYISLTFSLPQVPVILGFYNINIFLWRKHKLKTNEISK